MVRNHLITLVLAAMTMTANAAVSDPTTLIVQTKGGEKVAFVLGERPKVTFTAAELLIETEGNTVYYPLSDMARFTFENVMPPTGITDITTNETVFKFTGDLLVFPSLPENSEVKIYSIDGMLVYNTRTGQTGEYSFAMSGLAAGTYVVSVNGTTYKILKR